MQLLQAGLHYHTYKYLILIFKLLFTNDYKKRIKENRWYQFHDDSATISLTNYRDS